MREEGRRKSEKIKLKVTVPGNVHVHVCVGTMELHTESVTVYIHVGIYKHACQKT